MPMPQALSQSMRVSRRLTKWRPRRVVQAPLQNLLIPLARHLNLFLVRGLDYPNDRVNAERFLRSRYWYMATDYVRYGTLDLTCRAILEHDVAGAVAELGVYQGDFALLMHSHLPDRPIHLFDTFEGFDKRDVEPDARNAFVNKFHDFANTSRDAVASRFPVQADVVLHPGWFPESAADMDDTPFALVSLDTDLYQPILAGLQWFWPKLSPGGYILVHDYNNGSFKGAKAAVTDFMSTTPNAAFCPIPDAGGTAVIGKPRAAA